MRTRLGLLLMLTAVAAVWTQSRTDAAKPAPPPPAWRCTLTLRDAPTDTIRSDGGGAYVDGVNGVDYHINRGPVQYNWLSVSFASTSPRFMLYPGQANSTAAYSTFMNGYPGTFEVKTLGSVPWTGVPYQDVMPFRAQLSSSQFINGFGQFDGDSNFTGGGASFGTSSVVVEPLDPCSWRITSYTSEQPSLLMLASGERVGTVTSPSRFLRLTEAYLPSNRKAKVRGDFAMPFSGVITVIGNNSACPAP